MLKISWSALLRHEECHFKEMGHRDGMHRNATLDGRNFIGGTVADVAMRRWLDQPEPIPGTLVNSAKEVFEELAIENPERPIRWKGSAAADQRKVLADVEEALTKLDPWLTEHVLPYDYQPEARDVGVIGVPDRDGTVRAIELFFAVDIAVKPTDFYSLYDLKVTRNDDYVRGKTLGQLTFYSLAWAARFGIPVTQISHRAFITPLATQFETVTTPTADDYRYMMTRITDYAQSVWADERRTKMEKDSDCSYRCDVRHACPLFAVPVGDDRRISFAEVVRRRKAGT